VVLYTGDRVPQERRRRFGGRRGRDRRRQPLAAFRVVGVEPWGDNGYFKALAVEIVK
jgi:hypothetical protein